jgi:hypothetical protein
MSVRNEFLRSTRSEAIAIVNTYLRNARTLAPVRTWFLWQGDHKHDSRDVVLADMPALRITPSIGQTEWIDELSHKTQIRFLHELWCRGTRITDFFDFWSAIEQAWFDGTNGLLTLLEADTNRLRVWQKTITAPAPAPQTFGGELGQYGAGSITVFMDITTGE